MVGLNLWCRHLFFPSYEFDVTKCMFSAGNITEKLRVAAFDCRGETVVDLYAGGITLFMCDRFPEHFN